MTVETIGTLHSYADTYSGAGRYRVEIARVEGRGI